MAGPFRVRSPTITSVARSLRPVTNRERTALVLLTAGAVLLLVAAAAFGGWRAAVAVAGGLMFGAGVLLGLDTEPPAAPLEDDGDARELLP